MKWTVDKLTALILVCSCIALVASGTDSEVKAILTMSAGYLFGASISEHREARKEYRERKEE